MKTISCFPTIAAAALLVAVSAGSPASAATDIGVQVAVNQAAVGTNPGEPPRRIAIGQNVVYRERIETDRAGQTQILFLDESAMSVGPGCDLVIDTFVYDPQLKVGRLAMSATRGVFRYVGGKLSKVAGAVTVETPAGTAGIRGGVMLMEATPQGRLAAIFVYGVSLTVAGRDGTTQTITRPGYEVTVAGPGAAPSAPFPASQRTIARLLGELDGLPGRHGGARAIPSDATILGSAPYADLSEVPSEPPDAFGVRPLPPVTIVPQLSPVGREPSPIGLR